MRSTSTEKVAHIIITYVSPCLYSHWEIVQVKEVQQYHFKSISIMLKHDHVLFSGRIWGS